ncbi:hypothetical protein N7451_010407 [Penicillium sp. IBT 35674x]|nr:hypothetical protein N7451_010407 [Penicillium sp. IBT 35674x]
MATTYLYTTAKEYELYSGSGIASTNVTTTKRDLDGLPGQDWHHLVEERKSGSNVIKRASARDVPEHPPWLYRRSSVDDDGDTNMGGTGCFTGGVLACPANSCSTGSDSDSNDDSACTPTVPSILINCAWFSTSQTCGDKLYHDLLSNGDAGGSYCAAANAQYKKTLGTTLSITSYDEFPPASVEEGDN